MLDQILQDRLVVNAALYVAGSTVGAIAHWISKWLNDEISCVMDMARTERKRTTAAICAQVTAAGVVVMSGAVEAVSPGAAFFSGIFQVGAIDAFVNKGKRAVWTDEQRERKQDHTKKE